MNLLKALMNISKCNDYKLKSQPRSGFENQATVKGKPLELFVKDSFCGVPTTIHPSERKSAYEKIFSLYESENHPPDAILKYGDAIEIKKIKMMGRRIHFNSSPPKSTLDSQSKLLTAKCRNCEKGWTIKDMIYAVGVLPSDILKMLFFVYGDCYAAKNSKYEEPFVNMKSKISEVKGAITTGKEFGMLKRVDEIMRTDLRIRPMWMGDSPWKVFKNIIPYDKSRFTLAAIMLKKKYDLFPADDRSAIEDSQFVIQDIEIRDPDAPKNYLAAKSLVYKKES